MGTNRKAGSSICIQGKTTLKGHKQPREDGESLSRGIQNPPGHKPEQHALNEPALAEGFDMMIS